MYIAVKISNNGSWDTHCIFLKKDIEIARGFKKQLLKKYERVQLEELEEVRINGRYNY